MVRAQTVPSLDRENAPSNGEPGIQLPATVAASTATAPMIDASTTLPLRSRYMYRPTNRAIGIVQAIVNVPQELPGMTTRAPSGNVIALFIGVSSCPEGTSIWKL